MKVIFISLPVKDNSPAGEEILPPEPYLLSGLTRQNRHHSEVCHIQQSGDHFLTDDADLKPVRDAQAICIITDTVKWPRYRTLLSHIRQLNPQCTIIAGGLHPTLFSEQMLRKTPVDVVIRGEMENSLTLLLEHLKNKKGKIQEIPGISMILENRIHHSPDPPALSDRQLEQLPFPLLEDLPQDICQGLSLETSRGMPFHRPLFPLLHPRQWRFISPVGIYQRLYHIREQYLSRTKDRFIHIVDPYFSAKFKRIRDFHNICKKKNETFSLDYHVFCSDLLNDSFLDCAGSFTRRIIFTPVSGSPQMLNRHVKGLCPEVIRDCVKTVQKHRFNHRVQFCFYLGLPGETPRDAGMTLNMAEYVQDLLGSGVRVGWWYPRPGTVYWNDLEKMQIRMPDPIDEIDTSCLMKLGALLCPRLNRQEQEKLQDRLRNSGLSWTASP